MYEEDILMNDYIHVLFMLQYTYVLQTIPRVLYMGLA